MSLVASYFLILFTSRVLFYGEKTDEEIKNTYEREKMEVGKFTYSDDGFHYVGDKKYFEAEEPDVKIIWTSITEIYGVKIDTLYADRIKLTIFTKENIVFSVDEDTMGWYIFLEHLRKELSITDFYLRLLSIGLENGTLIWKRGISNKMKG